jgi:hypothetical protein
LTKSPKSITMTHGLGHGLWQENWLGKSLPV